MSLAQLSPKRLRQVVKWRGDERTRRSVFYSLLLVLVLFCAAIGFGLGSNNMGAMAVIVCSFLAMIVMQIAYLITIVVRG